MSHSESGMGKADFLEHVRDIEMMIKWYEQGAQSGNADSLYALGVCYEIGRGVEKSGKRAFELYSQAAAMDHADAYLALSEMYEKGVCVNKSKEKAHELLIKAAELGQEEAIARIKAEESNAEAGFSFPDTMYLVAQDLLTASPNDPPYESIAMYLTAAAEKGHSAAQYELGELYAKGLGVKQSDDLAKKWITASAEQGYASAQYRLGMMYLKGLGVTASGKSAAIWFEKAAMQGQHWS